MLSHNAASLADPISTVGRPNERARALKWAAGQRLAGPYSAPGTITT